MPVSAVQPPVVLRDLWVGMDERLLKWTRDDGEISRDQPRSAEISRYQPRLIDSSGDRGGPARDDGEEAGAEVGARALLPHRTVAGAASLIN